MEPVTQATPFDLMAQNVARSLLTWMVLLAVYCVLALQLGLPLPAWAPAAGLP